MAQSFFMDENIVPQIEPHSNNCQYPLINYLDEDETDVKTENENDPENPEKVAEKSPKKKSKKEYTCQLCFKNFKDSYKLKRHGKVHQVRVSEIISCEELANFFPQILHICPILGKITQPFNIFQQKSA